MLTTDYKEKLIRELNLQLEDGSFYTLNDTKAFSFKDDVDTFDSIKYEQASAFSGLARITGFEMDKPVQNNLMKSSINSYFDSIKIDGSNLYRPMVSSFSNPLEKNVYTYKPTFDLAINGMAFLSKNGGIVENPLTQNINIVNNITQNTIAQNPIAFENDFVSEIGMHKVEPVALNTYNMADILNDSKNTEELQFNTIPKEYALTTVSKPTWRDIFFKQVDIFKGLRNIFLKQKIK